MRSTRSMPWVGAARRAGLTAGTAVLLAMMSPAQAQQTLFLDLGVGEGQNSGKRFTFLPVQVAQTSDETDDQSGLTPLSGENGVPFYKIGVGDSIDIVVWRFPDLSTTAVVRPDGYISVPLVEDLRIVGMTPTEAGEAIEARLAEFIQDPLVTLVVTNPVGTFDQQIRVVGNAAQPRALPWQRDLTVADVITSIGGLTPNADGNGAILLRREGGTTREIPLRLDDLIDDGDLTANVAMRPGDVIIVPEGFFSGDWRVSYGANAEATFTDNVDLDPDGEKDAALILRSGPSISITADAARIQGAFSGNFFLVQEISDSAETNIDADVVGSFTAELVDQLAFVDASASVSRVLIDNRESQSGSDANTTNQEFVQAYRLSPYLRFDHGGFASSEVRYRASAVFIDSDDASNTITNEISGQLNSGRDFSFLGWGISASASEEVSSDDDDISRRDANFSLFYPLPFDRSITVEGSVGYRILESDGDDENDNITGVTWRTGLSWRPNPRFEGTAGVGSDAESIVFDADVRYEATPRLTLTASFVDETTTQQERIANNLPGAGDDLGGFNSQPNSFSIEDGITRTRIISGGARWSKDNVTTSLDLSYEEESEDVADSANTDEQSFNLGTTVDVGLSRDLTLVSSFRASYSEFDEDDDNDVEVEIFPSIGLQYQVSRNFRTNLTYSYSQRIADDEDDEFTENAVTVSGSINF